MIYLMMGQIGSGKSEQSKQLAQHHKAIHLGLGQLLREHYPDNPALSTGELLDRKLVTDAVDSYLNAHPDDHIVIDGFPRNREQQRWLDRHIQTNPHHELAAVFVLSVDDEAIDQRLLARGRPDDTPEAIASRKNIFEQEVRPVIEDYRQRGLVIDIDGNRSVEEVNAQVQSLLPAVAS